MSSCARHWRILPHWGPRLLALVIFFANAMCAQTGGLLDSATGRKAAPAAKSDSPQPVRKDFVKPGAPKDGPAPFLTDAVDWDIDTYGKFKAHLILPTREKIQQPFADLPFAIHVPFEVPFEAGVTRVFFDLNLVWDEPEQKVRIGSQPLFSSISYALHRQGIYRLDGTPVAADQAEWEIDNTSTTKFIAPASTPYPFLLNGDLPTERNPRATITTNLDINSPFLTSSPRHPFANENGSRGMFATGRPLVLRATPPGWYALWFTINRRGLWPPEKLRPDDTLHAKLYIHYIVARRERLNGKGDYFSDHDLDYLWDGRDAKLDRPLDPKLVRAYSVELPIVLRRDGWVLSRVELRRDTDRFPDRSLAEAGKDWSIATVIKGTAAPNANGVTAKFELSRYDRDRTTDPWPAQPRTASTLTWDITLPREIPDGGVGEITAKGTVREQGFEKDYWKRIRAGQERNLPSWFWGPLPLDSAIDKLGLSSVVQRVETDREKYLQSWAEKFGDPGATKYFPQPADLLAPEKENEAKRYFVYAQTLDPDSWFTLDPARTKLFYQDLGAQPLVNFMFGPWTADGYYRRKKDLDKLAVGTPAAGPTKLIEEKDPFWKWYPTFSALLRQKLQDASVAERQIALLREPLQAHRRTARRLLDALQGVGEAGGWFDWAFGSSTVRATFPPEMEARMLREAGRANTAAQNLRTAAQQQVKSLREAYQAILAEIDRVYPAYIDQHPELVLWKRHYRALLEAVDLKAAVATSDLGMFQAALAKLEGEDLLPEVMVMQAQLQIENGDAVGALEPLRRAARQEAGTTDAHKRLRDLECSFIKVALEKSHGAIADARNHFHEYLKERGMSGEKHAWVGGVHNPLSALDTESAWAVFTTGVTGSVSGLLGRAEEEGRAVDAVDRDMTTAYLGAQAILRLRMRKHELEEIHSMSTEKLRAALLEERPNAPPLDPAEARNLGLAIHRAFQLPELAAMLSEDPRALREGLAKGYWDSRMVGNTWAEWVGDVSSPKNLVMTLLPMSIGRVGGQLQGVSYWTRAEAGLIQAAVREGYVDTGSMVVARMVGWNRVVGWMPEGAAEYLVKLLERSQKYQESFGLFGQTGWSLGKVVATMALQGVAVHEAEQYGGPNAALLMETLLLFGGDTDLLCKFLDGARIPRKTIAVAIRQRALPQAERQLVELRGLQNRLAQGENLLTEMHSGRSLAEARAKAMGSRPEVPGAATNPVTGARPTGSGTQPARSTPVGAAETGPVAGARPTGSGTSPARTPGPTETNPVAGARPTGSGTGPARADAPGDPLAGAVTEGRVGPPPNSRSGIPNGQPGNDSSIAIVAAEEGMEQATDSGASGAAKSFQQDLQREVDDLAGKKDELRSLADKLESTPPAEPVPPRAFTGATARVDIDVVEYRLPGQPQGNDVWIAAERALNEGRCSEAEDLFRELKKRYVRDAQAGKPLGAQDLHIDIIEARIEQARALQTLPPPTKDLVKAKAIMQEIPSQDVDGILALDRTTLGHQGISGEVARTKGSAYVVKRVGLGGPLTGSPAELEGVVEAEVIAAEVRQAFGIATPGTNVKAEWRVTADGHIEMVSAQLVYRDVAGKGLEKASVGELYHLREQVAEDRAIAILIGDFDRKPDNYMVADGVVHALDGGVADPRGLRQMGGYDYLHPLFVSGRNGRDHWYVKAWALLGSASDTERAAGRQIFLSEMSLTSQAAERAANRVEKILGDPTARESFRVRLRDAYKRLYRDNPRFNRAGASREQLDTLLTSHCDDLAEQAVKATEARLEPMKKAIRKLNERNGLPLSVETPGTSLLFFPPARENYPFGNEERLAA